MRVESTSCLFDLMGDCSFESLTTLASPGAHQQSLHQSIEELIQEPRQGTFLNLTLYSQQHHWYEDPSCQDLSQERMTKPPFSPTNSDWPSDLYQPSVEQLIGNTIAPTNIFPLGPSPLPTSGSPCGEFLNWADIRRHRYLYTDGTWSCAYAGCNSQKKFARRCDFRQHFKNHIKLLSCRHLGCPQAAKASFATAKDRARHETKHNPTVRCPVCERVFSRTDNMIDHMKRKHKRA